MGTPAFPDLGKHCAVPECSLVDFLPFTCNACKKVFCLDHRSYSDHKCPRAGAQDVTVVICPICAKGVREVQGEDPNVTLDRHIQSDCDPSNYAKVNNKPKCAVRGCKESLTFSNKVRCKDCGREVCLKHRFGADHACKEFRRADSKKSVSLLNSKFLQSFNRKATISPQQSSSANGDASGTSQMQALRAGFQTAASSVEKSMSKFGATTADFFKTMRGSNSTDTSANRGLSGMPSPAPPAYPYARELCSQCGATFSNVSELIQHAETMHTAGGQWRLVNPQEQQDLCPACGKGFRDPVALVNHMEVDHRGSSR